MLLGKTYCIVENDKLHSFATISYSHYIQKSLSFYTFASSLLPQKWVYFILKWFDWTLYVSVYKGRIQILYRERVKSQNLGNRTLNSESASKIMPACDIWALECMCKCLFFQKTISLVLMGKLPQKWTNLKTFWLLAILMKNERKYFL